MTVRVERLAAPAPSLMEVAPERIANTTMAMLVRWWQRPTGLIMSEDWLNEHARSVSARDWS